MRILNIEDDVFKHSVIKRVLTDRGTSQIDWAGNMEEALRLIRKQCEEKKPYDLIITDMYFPEKKGGPEAETGEKMIRRIKEEGWEIPVIVCSSVRYRIDGIDGSVHYSPKEDWADELVKLVEKCCG